MWFAFTRAIAQFSDPAVRSVFWKALAIAAIVFVILWAAIAHAMEVLTFIDDPDLAWLEKALDVLGFLAVPLLSWLLFPAVMNFVIAWLLEDVAEAVEARHYPALPPGRELSFVDGLVSSVRLLAKMLVLNAIALVFLLIPPLFPFVFFAVNGYLLGREYFELAAQRRLDRDQIEPLRIAHRGPILGAGVVTAVLLSIPIVNLVAPVIATAAMVHLVEEWRVRG
jgi:CysZ protein